MDRKQEYVILLDLLARAINANKGFSTSDISDGERLLDAHYLANKFIGHALTVLYLSRGTSAQDLPSFKQFSFIDSASINVLTRATMEAFLVFHYVFFAPPAVEEKDYRYWCYKAAGFAERQNLPKGTYEHEQQKEEEQKALEEIRDKLESNRILHSLRDGQKRQIFEGKGGWRWKPDGKGRVSWRDIAIDAGFSKMLATHMYMHLSGHAHSSSLSVFQSQKALLNKETEQLIGSSIDTMKVLTANMIQEYCRLFPKALTVLRESGASQFVEMWVHIGRRLDENLDISQDSD